MTEARLTSRQADRLREVGTGQRHLVLGRWAPATTQALINIGLVERDLYGDVKITDAGRRRLEQIDGE